MATNHRAASVDQNRERSKQLWREECRLRLGFEQPPHRLPYETFRTDYRIGMIGLHWVVLTMHLPAYKAARFNVAVAGEINADRIAESKKSNLPVGRYVGSWQEVIADPDVQVIDCCFGHRPGRQEARMEVVQAAGAAGKHVMIHKPAAYNLKIAQDMSKVAADAGIQLVVNQDCRYNPAMYSIKQLLTPDRFGPARLIEVQAYWRGNLPAAGDMRQAWLQHVIHHADAIRWWADSPCVSVYSKAAGISNMIIYEFANGALAYQMENHSGVEAHDVKIAIMAERGVIRAGHNWNWHFPSSRDRDFVHAWRDTTELPVILRLPEHIYEPVWSECNPWMPLNKAYYDIAAPVAGMMGTMGSLMRGLSEGKRPDNHIDLSLESLRMCLAAQLSAQTGKPVNPAEVPDDATALL